MKKVFSFLLICLLLLCLVKFPSESSAASEGNFDYTVTDGEATITRCNGRIYGSLKIPSTLGGYPVTSIADQAFQGCEFSSIIIPEGVTNIGWCAFAYCYNLKSISIPDSIISIAGDAFLNTPGLTYNTYDNAKYFGNESNPYVVLMKVSNTDISACEIHEDTRIIYTRAFQNCTKLTSITIPDSVTGINNLAFYSSKLTNISIGNGLRYIGANAFFECSNLTDITIPNSIIEVADSAFGGCYNLNYNVYDNAMYLGNESDPYVVLMKLTKTDITSCAIPASTKIIYELPFRNCKNLAGIWVDENNPAYSSDSQGVLFNKDQTILLRAPNTLAGHYIIPSTVQGINSYAFYNCTAFTNIAIPDGVVSIGESAFEACYNLSSVTIPDSVSSLGSNVFQNCTNLTSLSLGNGITKIPKWAFSGTALTGVTIPKSVAVIGENSLSIQSLTEIILPNSITHIGDWAFYGCTNLSRVIYCGTAEQWSKIVKGTSNNYLTEAQRSYHQWSTIVTTEPTYTSMGKGTIVCEYCGEVKETVSIPAKFYGTSVNLGNTLDMYFGFYTGLVDTNGKVVFVREFADGSTETTEAPITAFNKNNSVYDITYTGLAAKEMCDTIHITVYNGAGQIVGQHSDSIRSYVLRQLREKAHDPEFRTLCVDLLNYGATAQIAFDYNPDDLANKDLTAEELAEGTQTVDPYTNKQSISGDAANCYYGTAYILETKISMCMAVRADYFGDGCYALVSYIDHSGTEKTAMRLEGIKNNSIYEFVLNEIVVADGQCLLTIDFYKADGTKIMTVQDSMESYAARNATEYPLAEKMLAFSDSAYKYLHRNTQ